MLNWFNKKRNKKGFTLVYLVLVIAILGILAALAVPKLISSRKNAAISAHNANVRTLEGAATMMLAQEGEPESNVTWKSEDFNDRYMQKWPKIPKGLVDEETIVSIPKKDGQADETEPEKIKAESEYTVTIDTNGGVIVRPGVIEPPTTD